VSGWPLALDQNQSGDHRCCGDRNAEIGPGASLGTEEPGWGLGVGKWKSWSEDAGADDAVVDDVVALEGLVAALTDHSAHRLRRQLDGKPNTGSGAARLVLAANEADRLTGHRHGKPSVVSKLHVV
jgi:hypothetical protein